MGNAGTVLNVTTVIIVVVCGQLFVAVVMVYLLAKIKKDIIANIYRKDKLIDMGFGALEIGILGKINEAINKNFIQREKLLKIDDLFSCTNPTCKRRKPTTDYVQDRLDNIGLNAFERRYGKQEPEPEEEVAMVIEEANESKNLVVLEEWAHTLQPPIKHNDP